MNKTDPYYWEFNDIKIIRYKIVITYLHYIQTIYKNNHNNNPFSINNKNISTLSHRFKKACLHLSKKKTTGK